MDVIEKIIRWYLFGVQKFQRRKYRTARKVHGFHLYYRICDQGYQKTKPEYVTKENCLRNALREFPMDKVDWVVFADNICDETYKMICKYIPQNQIKRVSVGHGAGTFRMVYEEAIKNSPNDLVYFLEDDYLHLSGSYDVLIESARCNFVDYFTLYDHPDKYGVDSPNPFVRSEGEKSIVYWCNNHHWKRTNSTTMTFAAFVDVLIRDQKTFWRWTESNHPYDFNLFTELKLSGKYLISALPGMSTHGETACLGLGVNWEDVL